jgi:hypothetical protein
VSKPDLQPVNLGSSAHGALMELFNLEIAKIAANIADSNTKATAKRKVTFELVFQPDADRKAIDVTTRASVKLAGIADHSSRIYLGKDTEDRPLLFDTDPRQDWLFEQPKEKENVLDFKQTASGE